MRKKYELFSLIMIGIESAALKEILLKFTLAHQELCFFFIERPL